MMGQTKIEWTERTWNPITGCSHAGSPGCDHCYARRMARRLAGRCGYPEYPRHFDVTLHPERLEEPLKRRKPTTYFPCSMSDLFHKDVPSYFIYRILAVVNQCPQHMFQILTKRADRMAHFFETFRMSRLQEEAEWLPGDDGAFNYDWPMANLWLGITAENQAAADERIPLLLRIPAAVRFVSCEPLLGSVDLLPYLANNSLFKAQHHAGEFNFHGEEQADGSVIAICDDGTEFYDGIDLHWVIVGGESGPGARPMHPDWVRSLRNQATAARVPFFMKQWGTWKPIGSGYNNSWSRQDDIPNRENRWVSSDGSFCGDFGPTSMARMAKVGKRAAGRLLDGQIWDEMPSTEALDTN